MADLLLTEKTSFAGALAAIMIATGAAMVVPTIFGNVVSLVFLAYLPSLCIYLPTYLPSLCIYLPTYLSAYLAYLLIYFHPSPLSLQVDILSIAALSSPAAPLYPTDILVGLGDLPTCLPS